MVSAGFWWERMSVRPFSGDGLLTSQATPAKGPWYTSTVVFWLVCPFPVPWTTGSSSYILCCPVITMLTPPSAVEAIPPVPDPIRLATAITLVKKPKWKVPPPLFRFNKLMVDIFIPDIVGVPFIRTTTMTFTSNPSLTYLVGAGPWSITQTIIFSHI